MGEHLFNHFFTWLKKRWNILWQLDKQINSVILDKHGVVEQTKENVGIGNECEYENNSVALVLELVLYVFR